MPPRRLSIALLICLMTAMPAVARDLKVSVAHIPGYAVTDEQNRPFGGFIDLVEAMDLAYEAGRIQVIGVFPFERSQLMVKMSPGPGDGRAFSTAVIGFLAEVLYTRSDRPPPDLEQLDQYRIDIIRGHKAKGEQSADIATPESGILKLLAGRSDGFLQPQEVADPYIRNHRIRHIRRQLHKQLPIHFIIRDSVKGAAVKGVAGAGVEIDCILSDIIRKLQAGSQLTRIMRTIHGPYDDWQPYEMEW